MKLRDSVIFVPILTIILSVTSGCVDTGKIISSFISEEDIKTLNELGINLFNPSQAKDVVVAMNKTSEKIFVPKYVGVVITNLSYTTSLTPGNVGYLTFIILNNPDGGSAGKPNVTVAFPPSFNLYIDVISKPCSHLESYGNYSYVCGWETLNPNDYVVISNSFRAPEINYTNISYYAPVELKLTYFYYVTVFLFVPEQGSNNHYSMHQSSGEITLTPYEITKRPISPVQGALGTLTFKITDDGMGFLRSPVRFIIVSPKGVKLLGCQEKSIDDVKKEVSNLGLPDLTSFLDQLSNVNYGSVCVTSVLPKTYDKVNDNVVGTLNVNYRLEDPSFLREAGGLPFIVIAYYKYEIHPLSPVRIKVERVVIS